jgi:hypothetical protein
MSDTTAEIPILVQFTQRAQSHHPGDFISLDLLLPHAFNHYQQTKACLVYQHVGANLPDSDCVLADSNFWLETIFFAKQAGYKLGARDFDNVAN